MAYTGLLPTPNVSQLKSPVMSDYVKNSYYPIPFQIVNIIESCNVSETASWNINVMAKNIKFNIEWNIGQSNCNIDIFPKAVVSTISTYNVEQPVWSTSFANQKLSLKIEWKLTSTNQNTCRSAVATPVNTTFHRVFPDSGYHSGLTTPYTSTAPVNSRYNSSLPRTKLFDSPRKHDVYRPNGNTSKNSPSTNPKNRVLIPPEPSAIHDKPEVNSSNVVPLNSNTKEYKAEQSKVSVPESVPESKPVKPSSTKPSVELIPNVHKFVIDYRSTDGNILTLPDPQNEDFTPFDDKFVKTPDDLKPDSNGLLHVNINADRMNIPGTCRLCKKSLKSHQVDAHLIVCPNLNSSEVDEFIHEVSEATGGLGGEINDQIFNYCELAIEDSNINDTFHSILNFKQFINNLESFLDKRAIAVFKKCNILGLQKRSNILNYNK
ncbi:Hypothetical predicted protein [Paramuricea clavata]|uniref:Uncharacterized protein n=1 Tax=Paramuricea clavata TaxID=317549 RepID=A0A7D9MCP8_PARCT|nr:Hypothetical predicted protein [Paramuricea clavata]